jgi:hypothetical protein
MNTLVVYESMFGNTRRLAASIARELEGTGSTASLVHASEAPKELAGYDLVVIGAPTHAHSLPQPSSRTEAAAWADDPARKLTLEQKAGSTGVREWLEEIGQKDTRTRFAAFSTRVDMPRIFSGDAAASIRKRLRHRGMDIETHIDFLVDSRNLLVPGEEQRAQTWASGLVPVQAR